MENFIKAHLSLEWKLDLTKLLTFYFHFIPQSWLSENKKTRMWREKRGEVGKTSINEKSLAMCLSKVTLTKFFLIQFKSFCLKQKSRQSTLGICSSWVKIFLLKVEICHKPIKRVWVQKCMVWLVYHNVERTTR